MATPTPSNVNEITVVLIVDDEPQSRHLVKTLLGRYPAVTDILEADSITSARHMLDHNKPQLVFLDIHLGHESGFDLLPASGKFAFGVIFITAHSDYAVRAFRYNAIDYLVKPIDPKEFDQAMRKAVHEMQNHVAGADKRYVQLGEQIMSDKAFPNKLTIPTTEGYMFVDTNDILYCKANGNYTEFQVAGRQRILSSYTLGYYDDLLVEHSFFRVHRSYLINLGHVQMYRKGEGGTVVMRDGTEIDVARGNKDAFLKLFRG